MGVNYEVRPDVERLPNILMLFGIIADTFEEMADFLMNCVIRWVYDLDKGRYVDDQIKCAAWVQQQVSSIGFEPFMKNVFAAVAEYRQQLFEEENYDEMPESLVKQINELLGDES